MGESLVERPTAVEKMMDESFNSIGGMEVSVSFGRFENDLLSWEKWSSFSLNKYLEEVGSLSTPGSVAQKKAYFEAHYKRIAAQKTEEWEQEMPMNPPIDESSNDGNYVESSCRNDAEIGLSDGHEPVDAEHADSTGANSSDEGNKGDDDIVAEHETSSLVEEAKDESKIDGVGLESNVGLGSASCEVRSEADSIKTRKKGSRLTMENPPSMKNGAKLSIPKSNPKGVAKEVISSKKGTNSTAIKPLPSSTPKHLKKAPASTPMAASHSKPLMKRANGSSATKSKKAVSTSLHTSLDLERSSPTIRKSLMTEKTGDEDIIKRTFKTFQDRIHGSCNDGKSTPPKQVKSAASEAKISSPPPPRKNGKEGAKNDVENISIRRNQSGNRSSPLDNTLSKSSATDKRNRTGVSSTISFRSNERAEKRTEFLQDSEAKPVARAAERAQISAKSKEVKESEIRKLRESLNFKAKPLPSFYKDQKNSHVKKIVIHMKA